MVGHQPRHAAHGLRQRIDVTRGLAAIALQHARAFKPQHQFARGIHAERRVAAHYVVEQFRVNTAHAHHHQRPERRIIQRADDEFDPLHHFLDQPAAQAGVRLIRDDAAAHIRKYFF